MIAAVCIPVQLLELGEEIGWREYLLPKQIAVYGVRKGILLNGFYWGIAHLPLIYFGFNYSSEKNGLLGPNPTGLIGMSGLILCAIIMLMLLQKEKITR